MEPLFLAVICGCNAGRWGSVTRGQPFTYDLFDSLRLSFPALNWRSLAQRHSAHWIEMQLSAYFQQIFFGLDYRTLESALKQVPDYLMPAIKRRPFTCSSADASTLKGSHPVSSPPDGSDSPSAHNIALLPCSALRLRSDSPETSADLDRPGKSLPVFLPRLSVHTVQGPWGNVSACRRNGVSAPD